MVKEAQKERADDTSRCAFVVSRLYASVIVRDVLARDHPSCIFVPSNANMCVETVQSITDSLALDSYREAYFIFNLIWPPLLIQRGSPALTGVCRLHFYSDQRLQNVSSLHD